MPTESIDYNLLINAIMGIVGALIGGRLAYFKAKLHAGRQLVDAIDDALADNTINEQEYASISKVLPFLMQKQ